MRSRFWVAYGALALALALLVPTLAPLSGSMDSFAHDLANGAFRPFGVGGKGAAKTLSGSLGGFTGDSTGNYVPGAGEVPSSWLMDRDGRGGNVVIDDVFDPSIGAMKRLKAYDHLGADGTTLDVLDKRYHNYAPDPAHVKYDTPIDASYDVQLHAGVPVPIFSPHPRPAIRTFSTSPPVPGLRFLQDGADTLYALSDGDITTTLNISFFTEARYYQFDIPDGLSVADYAGSLRPTVPPSIAEDAKVVLARAGAGDGHDLGATLTALNAYFRSFTEGDIPPPSEVESLYLALALGGHGCCRHRAFAYMVTAQSLGIPARVVVNEAHAFVEVMLPDGSWRQANLGGCGTYTENNPEHHASLFPQAADPRREANPDEDRPLPTVATFTNVTDAPARIVKGERYLVNGTVESSAGRGVPGARVDVYLNETKATAGRLTGAGITDAAGRFSIEARVPADLPAQSYQLVARAQDPGGGSVRYLTSWSDPQVSVFAPTQLVFPKLVAAVGFPANVTGRLLDVDGQPVTGASISWNVGGTNEPALRTDDTGRFSARVTFDSVGQKVLSFAYAGDDHHGAAQANATVDVSNGALLIPADAPTLARGETGPMHGSIAVAGAPLGGRDVAIAIMAGNDSTRVVARGTGSTDGAGAFSVPLAIARSLAPGIYPARYSVATLNLNASGLVRIAIRPTLAFDAPSSVSPGEAWEVHATLASDNGTEISGGLVQLTVDGNESSARSLLTNRTGVARFSFAPRSLVAGAHAIEVSFPGDADHAEISRVARVDVVRPWFATIPAWVYAGAIAGVLAVALAAWLLRSGGPARAIVASARTRRPDRWRIEATHPDHPAGVPPVVEPGERARIALRVRRRDGENVPARLVVDAPQGRQRGRASGTGWIVEATAPEAGALVLHARATGLARLWTIPLTITIPVQPYRRAVEDGFVALRRRARLSDAASPADIVRALGPRLPSAAQPKLREMTALFEVADYSERPVDRAFYHAFALARRDLERALEARDG